MKKLILVSLLTVFAATAANAGNIINNNPLYRPDQGRFYSITGLETHSKADLKSWALNEEFGYGITKDLAVILGTSASTFEHNIKDKQGYSWDDFSIGLNYRVLNHSEWKADVFGTLKFGDVWGDHRPFLDKDDTTYLWTVGVRGGYATDQFTVAGHIAYDYSNSEAFNWGDKYLLNHKVRLGLDGQYVLTDNWNLTAGAEYTGIVGETYGAKNLGITTGTFGVNYNIDTTKFVGAYIGKEYAHATGEWEPQDGFVWGAKFGIDF
ncbi:MAG: hypothetical protein LBJ18_03440 [Rickettsiales bacterium]|jgi:hypothetical protein|nr:hypothetical protein [Rickettsiales bacterium]